MKNKYCKYLITISVTLIIFSFVITAFAEIKDLVFTNSNGNVVFRHSTHSSIKCKACHPTPFKKVYNDDVSIEAESHEFCKNCHVKMDKGPTSCSGSNGCHQNN